MKNQLTTFLLSVVLLACTPATKISVTNLHDLAAYQPNSMIYALPRTEIAIELEIIRHHSLPGPYYAYAEKYLGIKGAPSISADGYEIATVSLQTFKEADPDYYYSLTSSNPVVSMNSIFKFFEQGLLLDNQSFIAFSEFRPLAEDQPEPIHYLDLSVKKLVSPGSSAGKEKGKKAEVPVDLPVTKPKGAPKTLEEKAKDASDFIIKIRKRRFKLLAGQYEVFPEGTALATAVEELDALEAEYLSLFIGKTYTDTLHQSFFYTPKAGQELEREVICRFSDESGLLDAGSAAGKPLVLELKSMANTKALKQVQFPQPGPVYQDVIFYRLPEQAQVRLFYGSAVLVEAREAIFQYGPLVPFSTSLVVE